MSNSPGDKRVVGTLRVPSGEIPPPPGEGGERSSPGEGVNHSVPQLDSTDPIAAEIQAEISDHLATAAEQLESQGIATADALQKSKQKFGDTVAIGRRCYWI